MNLSKGLAIGGSDNVVNDFRVSSHVTLNRGIHVHLIKQDEVFAAFAIGLHGFVLIDGFCQADSEERRERQGLPRGRFVLSQECARPGHIDFEQAMDHGLVLDGPIRKRLQAPHLRIRDHLVSSVLLFHYRSPSRRWDKTFVQDPHLVVPISIGDRPFISSVSCMARRHPTSGPPSVLSRRALEDALFLASHLEGGRLAKRAVQCLAQRPFSWIFHVGPHPVEDVCIPYPGLRVSKSHGPSRSWRSKRARMTEGVLRGGLRKPK